MSKIVLSEESLDTFWYKSGKFGANSNKKLLLPAPGEQLNGFPPGQMAPLLFKDLPKTRKKAEGLTVRTYVARSGTVMEFSSKTYVES